MVTPASQKVPGIYPHLGLVHNFLLVATVYDVQNCAIIAFREIFVQIFHSCDAGANFLFKGMTQSTGNDVVIATADTHHVNVRIVAAREVWVVCDYPGVQVVSALCG